MVKKVFYLVLIIFLFLNDYNLKSQSLSNYAEVSVLTCAPGEDLYSTFGHSAIRIKDPALRIDKVYNYGTFNFETPNFYLKFVRGQLDYMLSASRYKYFIIPYINENRWIKEQVLDLSQSQKNDVFLFLENNLLPENKYYRYDFFYDNCATRVKDVIKDVIKDDLNLPKNITKENETFRHLIHKYLIGKNWERYGINLALGQPTDKVVSAEEATFLPDYLNFMFENAVLNINGTQKPLVKETLMIFEPKNINKRTNNSILRPVFVLSFLFLFFLVISFLEYKNTKYYVLLDKAIFFISGIVGVILLLLWFGTEHSTTIKNWNLVWAMPLFLIASFKLKESRNKNYIKVFFLIMSILMFLSIIGDIFLMHLYDYSTIPVVMVLTLRSFLIFKKH